MRTYGLIHNVLTRRFRSTSNCLSTAPGKYPNCASITARSERKEKKRKRKVELKKGSVEVVNMILEL